MAKPPKDWAAQAQNSWTIGTHSHAGKILLPTLIFRQQQQHAMEKKHQLSTSKIQKSKCTRDAVCEICATAKYLFMNIGVATHIQLRIASFYKCIELDAQILFGNYLSTFKSGALFWKSCDQTNKRKQERNETKSPNINCQLYRNRVFIFIYFALTIMRHTIF